MTFAHMPPETRQGDIIVRDRAVFFHVWRVTRDGATEPDRDIQPFATDRRHEALEKAVDMARGSDARVFVIDRAGVWTEARRPGSRIDA
jgi:hypothetical protein